MINIKSQSRPFTPVERYAMTVSPGIVVMKDVPDNTTLEVTGWLDFDDVNEKTGEVKNLLSVITTDRKAYSCQSATFRRSLMDAITVLDTDSDNPHSVLPIIKFSGKNKSGREFINCMLDVERFTELYPNG